MSVIFGIKENNRIIIAGDKRGSSIDGKTLSDDLDKVLMINDHLAFSSAGNAAIEKAISIDLNKATNKDCLTTDDLLDIIKAFYKRVADTNCDAILALPFYFLIAGKGRDGNASLISGGNIKGRLDAKDVPMALFPPADAKMQECCDCFAKNYKLHNSEFVEKTIKEIANISNLVSPTGNKWIYNIATETSKTTEGPGTGCRYPLIFPEEETPRRYGMVQKHRQTEICETARRHAMRGRFLSYGVLGDGSKVQP